MTKSEKAEVFREQSERVYLLCCWTVVSQEQIKTFSDNLGPVNTFPNSFSNGDFCYGLAYRPRLSAENGHRKRVFYKPSPAWISLKTPLCTGVDGWKRRFSLKTITSRCWIPVKEHARMKESNDSKNARNCRGFCFENGDNKNFRFQSKNGHVCIG